MKATLHITSGDSAGSRLKRSGIPGETFVWHDMLYDGPRNSGWPDSDTLLSRVLFLESVTDGGLRREYILETLKNQYRKLETAYKYDNLFLWFDGCLFDQSMLTHILACLVYLGNRKAELICIDAFPGIDPYHGLGQLRPEQLALVYNQHDTVTHDQFLFADRVDRAFALQDQAAFIELTRCSDAPLPWIPAAVYRWLQEQPDSNTGLGRLEKLALDAIRSGCQSPGEIFENASLNDTPPQFWGDITLWAKINALADHQPPLVRIEGPGQRLPQWEGIADLKRFRVYPLK